MGNCNLNLPDSLKVMFASLGSDGWGSKSIGYDLMTSSCSGFLGKPAYS